jgi:hypothetical protein
LRVPEAGSGRTHPFFATISEIGYRNECTLGCDTRE